MIEVDPQLLVHTVAITKVNKKDEWGEETLGESITCANVRVDLAKEYSGVGNDRTIIANGTVYFYTQYTSNMPDIDDSWLQATVEFKHRTYKLVSYATLDRTDSAETWAIEAEVL